MSNVKRSLTPLGNLPTPSEMTSSITDKYTPDKIAAANLLSSLFSGKDFSSKEEKVVPIANRNCAHKDGNESDKVKEAQLKNQNHFHRNNYSELKQKSYIMKQPYMLREMKKQPFSIQTTIKTGSSPQYSSLITFKSNYDYDKGKSTYDSVNCPETDFKTNMKKNDYSLKPHLNEINNQSQEIISCTCKKSKCLKLYW